MQTNTPSQQPICELCTIFDNDPSLAQQFNARYVARVKRAGYAIRNNLEVPREN